MKKTNQILSTLGALTFLSTIPAAAQELKLAADASGSSAVATPAAETATPAVETGPLDVPYMKRYIPEAFAWELGLFGGVMFPSKNHQLYDQDLPSADRQAYRTAGEIGARVAFYPASFLGLEVEASGMPASAKDGSAAGLWAVRGHGILQLPMASVTPFLLVGGGTLGASSDSMGNDNDHALHFGLGVKAALDKHLLLRLDVRDTMTAASRVSGAANAHSPELLLGLSFVPKRSRPDKDGDGFLDYQDECPSEVGTLRGCVPPPPDADADGVVDEADQCVDVVGVAPSGCPDGDADGLSDLKDPCPELAGPLPSGCPEKVCAAIDTDSDGLVDSADQCPTEAAKTPTGCIIYDQDGDGLTDDKDKCPTDAENRNGFEDEDGCADVIPEKVSKFTGIIKGIEFDFGSAKIKNGSKPLLSEAAGVLKAYPQLKVKIVGHSDNQGDRETNLKVSAERAESVKAYLVQEGVGEAQLKTKGAGPDLPIADNATPAGRQKNRRIEFSIIND